MKHMIFPTITLGVALLAAPVAMADAGIYAGASLGAVALPDQDFGASTADSKAGADMSFYLGYDFGQVAPWGGVRVDLQFSGQAAEVSGVGDGEYLAGGTFLNVYADYNPTGTARWVPYVGFGIGRGNFEFDDYETDAGKLRDDSDSAWGAQAIVGLSYLATDHLRVFADLRHSSFDDVTVTEADGRDRDVTPGTTSFNLGVAYHF